MCIDRLVVNVEPHNINGLGIRFTARIYISTPSYFPDTLMSWLEYQPDINQWLYFTPSKSGVIHRSDVIRVLQEWSDQADEWNIDCNRAMVESKKRNTQPLEMNMTDYPILPDEELKRQWAAYCGRKTSDAKKATARANGAKNKGKPKSILDEKGSVRKDLTMADFGIE